MFQSIGTAPWVMFMKTKSNKVGRILSPTELTLQSEKREEEKVNGIVRTLIWGHHSSRVYLEPHSVTQYQPCSYKFIDETTPFYFLYTMKTTCLFVFFFFAMVFYFYFIFLLPKGPRMFLSVYNFWILVAFFFYIFYSSLWHIKKKNKTSTLCHPIYIPF